MAEQFRTLHKQRMRKAKALGLLHIGQKAKRGQLRNRRYIKYGSDDKSGVALKYEIPLPGKAEVNF